MRDGASVLDQIKYYIHYLPILICFSPTDRSPKGALFGGVRAANQSPD